MKTTIKWMIIISTVLIFAYAFSSSYNSHNIDHLNYVIAIGIDKSPNENNLQVSFEFTDLSAFSESSSSTISKPIIDTIAAPSISDALNIMNAYSGKQVNLSHCKVVIFSEEVAKNGILPEITYLMNDSQIRPTTNIIISTENAKNYIENSTSSLEGILTKYYDIFPTSAEYTGYTSNIKLNKFYQNLINPESGAVAILGTKSKGGLQNSSSNQDNSSSQNTSSENNTVSEQTSKQNISTDNSTIDSYLDNISPGVSIVEGDRGTENIGLAVFKDNDYIGKLSAIETLCYTLIKEEVDNFSVCIDNPFEENKKIDISVSSLEPTYTEIDISKENPLITIKLNLTAKALTGQDSLNFSNKETLIKINESLKNYLTSKMKDFLYKTSKEYKCDINEFYRLVRKKFLTIPEYKNYNWKEKYQNTEFNIEINSNVISSFLVQNS